MAKGLHRLIRLHQYRVDEKRRSLGKLLGEAALLEEKSKNLEHEIIAEQEIANLAPDSVGMFYGHYATAAVKKREQIALEIDGFAKSIAVAQEEMREEYKDMKVFVITQESHDRTVALETIKEEQAILDELGQEAYRRRSQAKNFWVK
jgi:flagellar FliJ protein